MSFQRRLCAGALSLTFAASLAALPSSVPASSGSQLLYRISLPGGESALVFRNGIAQIYSKDHKSVQTRVLQTSANLDPDASHATLPERNRIVEELMQKSGQPFAENRVIVVFRDGVGSANDVTTVDKATLLSLRKAMKSQFGFASIPRYTNDSATNSTLAAIGTDRSERLFRNVDRSTLSMMRSNAQSGSAQPVLNIVAAYRLHITGASVRKAVERLSKLPSVAYASPDWAVAPMHSPSIPLAADSVAHARAQSSALRMAPRVTQSLKTANVPANYAVSASAQSMLNAPSVDAIAAYDEIDAKFHQLPGQGETITNVSLGDLDDANAAANPSDTCHNYASAFGPTTVVIGSQRYINWPSMPLIPTYTSDASGHLNGGGEVCGVDPYLGEIGLDFSAMAPLPSTLQRPGEQGGGLTDLLGIAPGASYRLIVPGTSSPTNSDILAAMLGAALQSPRTNVINASLGFPFDQYGFSGRYLEDDPLMEAVIASIVRSYNIVVTISAGDGVRTYTTVAIGPNGGSAPTNVIPPGAQPTDVNDVGLSGVPSRDFDSGSIDVGGTTLDDLFARPPQYSTGDVVAQHAYAETRWTGFTNFSSGDGSRVNVSAPSDNIVALGHPFGGAADAVSVSLNGGTSASAPETAAAAAVVLQVARLTGHPMTALQVRDFLASTGSPVLAVPQADSALNVGPQIDVRRAVETLLARAGSRGTPAVPRVAIEQRRNAGNLDGAFISDTDPNNIALNDPSNQDRYQTSWITIAPDWEWLPAGAQYNLYVTGHPDKPIARSAWARALPKTILAAAGMPIASSSTRTVHLTYDALQGSHKVASSSFALTFGPTNATHYGVLAPNVPPVITGSTIPVTYDLRDIRGVNNPQVVISEPGRMSPATGQLFHPIVTMPLASLNGTVNVPVAALGGGGMYGVDVIYDSAIGRHSDPAFTRVVPAQSTAAHPVAPLLANNGSTPGHFLEIPYNGSFQVSYDVTHVPGATGAMIEVSAAGPGAWGIYNPFNNPSGTLCDKNGIDTGSIYCAPVPGTSGTITLNAKTIGLTPSLNHVVRVIPMKFGVAAGEAGEVSTVTMDGVFASDGGGVQNGFGVSPSGFDGFITSGQLTASGQILTSLETFDQTNNQIVQNVSSANNSLYYTIGNAGIFGNDVALVGLQDETTFNSTFNLLDTVSSGTLGSGWTPVPNVNVLNTAPNTANDIVAFFASDPSVTNGFRVFTSDIVHNTNGPLYDVSGPIANEQLPNVWGFGENTSTNLGVLPAEDFFGNCNAPTIVTVDLTNGTVGSFNGMGAGFPYGIAVDSTANKAAIPTLCDGGLTIYDLASKSGNEIFLPGNFNGFYTESDPRNQRFLVEQTVAPNFGTNNNSLSRVLVYDEAGNLQETKEQFDLFRAFLPIQAHNLQVNPTRHVGYLIGPFAQQLEPFTY